MLWVYLLHLLPSFFFSGSNSQPQDRWLVQIAPGNQNCIADWAGANVSIKPMPVEGWFAVKVPPALSGALAKLPCVVRVLPDQKIEWRDTDPNDPAYINQGDMELIGMPKAWDVTTGGLTTRGDTIVVALIDDGYEITHPDLRPNLWYNFAEIPDDGIDNDINGYTDDFQGYNVSNGNDNHPVKTHGTSVAGIVGARGNNGVGVTGVNWHVKLMLISGADFESELIDAYEYVRDLREEYIDSDGAKGAFVVATNLSGGVNGVFAKDHPLWCQMYDRLGELGILSVCAAPNLNISVDVDGDMPTTCTSPYMIAVTNVDLTDELVGNAGYGSTSIDIGAPGHGTVTTASGNMYKEFTGTSSATPHVTGTIALMYSTPCEFFLDEIDTHPAQVAERVRDIIFDTGKNNSSLNSLTVTGKRLQADAALRATDENCSPTVEDKIEILYVGPNPVHQEQVHVGFQVVGDTSTAYFELYAVNGMKLAHFPIRSEEFASQQLLVPTATLPAGIYMLSLRNQKQKVTRKIFVY